MSTVLKPSSVYLQPVEREQHAIFNRVFMTGKNAPVMMDTGNEMVQREIGCIGEQNQQCPLLREIGPQKIPSCVVKGAGREWDPKKVDQMPQCFGNAHHLAKDQKWRWGFINDDRFSVHAAYNSKIHK